MRYIAFITKFILLGFLLPWQFASCDLTDEPDNLIDPDSLITNPAQAQAQLNSAYGALRYGGFYNGNLWLVSELVADHISDAQNMSSNARSVYNRQTNIFLDPTRAIFREGGKAVGRANQLLYNIEKGNVIGLTQSERTRMIAEIKFIRALVQFELVRLFAKPYDPQSSNDQLGIAIHNQLYTTPVNRSSVALVYQSIINQLTEAAADLPASNGVYANSWSAKGLLAKVFFQMNDFQRAYDAAETVISSSPYSFDDSLQYRFGRGESRESVFQLVSNLDRGMGDNAGGEMAGYYANNSGNAQFYASSPLYNKFAANDKRGKKWLFEDLGKIYVTKFRNDSAFHVPIVHITELKLIRAEAAAELGSNLAQSAQDISDIRLRAGLTSVSSGVGAPILIELARQEREKEMIMEGNRIHELKRQAVRGNRSLRIRNAPWDCNGMVLQIPDNELSGVPGMQPNPEGGCN